MVRSRTKRRGVAISLKNVDKSFSSKKTEVRVFAGLNLEVARGEFLCILGQSGTGKTTLLNILAGFIKPDDGKVLADGELVNGPGDDRAVVFQDNSIFPWLTVYDNIAYGPKIKGTEGIKSGRIEELLGMIGLGQFRDFYPKELSGGMKKRVDLARAFANEPTVMLMDEPFAALDEITKESLQVEIMRMWEKERNTIIFVTHNIEEAILLADRVVVLGDKGIKAEVEIPLMRPRNVEIKMSGEFQKLRGKIKELI